MLKKFVTISMAFMFMFTMLYGCGSNPQPIPTPTPTTLEQIESYAAIAGGLAAGLLPSLDGAQGAAIVLTIKNICALKGSNGDPSALMALVQAELQKLWLQVDASGVSGIAIVAAVNVLWAYLQTSVAGQDTSTALQYVNAAIDGLCTGFGVPTGQTSFSGKIKLAWYKLWHVAPKAKCCQ